MCDDIWTYDFKTKKTEQLVDTLDQEIEPMWFKDRIYFLSDREPSKRMNLYVLNLATKVVKQVTTFADFDVKFPSLGDKAIAFEQAGFIWKLDLETDKVEKISIELNEDFATSRTALLSVADKVASGTPSPDGKRVCLSARGELFTIPSGPGITRNFTNSPGRMIVIPIGHPMEKISHSFLISRVKMKLCSLPPMPNPLLLPSPPKAMSTSIPFSGPPILKNSLDRSQVQSSLY